MTVAPMQFKEILVLEALPLISQRPPELSNQLVNRMMAITFEYFINEMFKEVRNLITFKPSNYYFQNQLHIFHYFFLFSSPTTKNLQFRIIGEKYLIHSSCVVKC